MLVVAPLHGTSFEAWRPAREGTVNCGPLWTTEWLVHSRALQVLPPAAGASCLAFKVTSRKC